MVTASPHLRRFGAAMLIAAPLCYLLAEAIAAHAWTAPAYSYTYNYISHLGTRGPELAFGQAANSPAAWVMNGGFITYGLLTWLGAALLLRPGPNRQSITLMLLAVLMGLGAILLGLFPGSLESVASGTIVFHLIGAQCVMLGGNLIAILIAPWRARTGLPAWLSRLLGLLGWAGLGSLAIFMIDVNTGHEIFVGLFERGAVYPVVASQILLGISLWRRPFAMSDTLGVMSA